MSDKRRRIGLFRGRPNKRIIRATINNHKNLIVENLGIDFNFDHLYRDIMWSKGPKRDNYSKVRTNISSNETNIINQIDKINMNDNILFIRNGNGNKTRDLEYFSNNLDKLGKLERPIFLITSDGDRAVPSSYDPEIVNNILNCTNIEKWYTQNYDESIKHDKLSHLPIGFDLHTSSWLINNNIQEKIKYMLNCRFRSPINKRISNRIYSDTHHKYSHNDRKTLYELIKNNNYIDFSRGRKSFSSITENYNKYNFVLSPRGNGWDCHRTWELFLAGVIVITKTSPLDKMYLDNNLPVVILNDWNELNDNIASKLEQWYRDQIDKTNIDNILPRLTFSYWIHHN